MHTKISTRICCDLRLGFVERIALFGPCFAALISASYLVHLFRLPGGSPEVPLANIPPKHIKMASGDEEYEGGTVSCLSALELWRLIHDQVLLSFDYATAYRWHSVEGQTGRW